MRVLGDGENNSTYVREEGPQKKRDRERGRDGKQHEWGERKRGTSTNDSRNTLIHMVVRQMGTDMGSSQRERTTRVKTPDKALLMLRIFAARRGADEGKEGGHHAVLDLDLIVSISSVASDFASDFASDLAPAFAPAFASTSTCLFLDMPFYSNHPRNTIRTQPCSHVAMHTAHLVHAVGDLRMVLREALLVHVQGLRQQSFRLRHVRVDKITRPSWSVHKVVVHGSWDMVYRTWFMGHGTWGMVRGNGRRKAARPRGKGRRRTHEETRQAEREEPKAREINKREREGWREGRKSPSTDKEAPLEVYTH